ncbi:Serine/threonine-protein phosphatase 2A activator 1 [Tulasnella sp. 418]|nr:Serine/threonine-protein phosphatase 2A activator 1 [Tulasnella sp. 418]
MTIMFPPLRQVILPHNPTIPTKKIVTDEDVAHWKASPGYIDYGLFVRRLNEAVVGHYLPYTEPKSDAVAKTVALLDEIEKWVEDIPPQESPQRFGNLAFRDWGKRLEERATSLLSGLLPEALQPAVPVLSPYFLASFGSFTRIDYGSGHELSFALLLCSLSLLRFYEPTESEERALVLHVFYRYLQLVWKLQDTYKLEPAGSHGVWGLDDYHFLSYLWGSGQVRDHPTSRPPSVLESKIPGTTLYNLSILRIHGLKSGPFHEHSNQLHTIATSVPTWWKVNQGLFKMYEAEVLTRRVVVQHLPLGGIIAWDSSEVQDEEEEDLPREHVMIEDDDVALGELKPAITTVLNASSPGRRNIPLPNEESSPLTTTTRAPWAIPGSEGPTNPATSENIPISSTPPSSLPLFAQPPASPGILSSPHQHQHPRNSPLTRQGTLPRPTSGKLAAFSGAGGVSRSPVLETPHLLDQASRALHDRVLVRTSNHL